MLMPRSSSVRGYNSPVNTELQKQLQRLGNQLVQNNKTSIKKIASIKNKKAFKNIGSNKFQKLSGDDYGSIWSLADVDGEQWIVVEMDGNGSIVRKASTKVRDKLPRKVFTYQTIVYALPDDFNILKQTIKDSENRNKLAQALNLVKYVWKQLRNGGKEVKGVDIIDNFMTTVRNGLSKLSEEQLDSLLSEWDTWFVPSDYGVEEERSQAKSRQEKIDLITSSDPVLAEGGLADFLYETAKKGIIPNILPRTASRKKAVDEKIIQFLEEAINEAQQLNTISSSAKDWAGHFMNEFTKVKSPQEFLGKWTNSLGVVMRAIELKDENPGLSELKALQQASVELKNRPELESELEDKARELGDSITGGGQLPDLESSRKRAFIYKGVNYYTGVEEEYQKAQDIINQDYNSGELSQEEFRKLWVQLRNERVFEDLRAQERERIRQEQRAFKSIQQEKIAQDKKVSAVIEDIIDMKQAADVRSISPTNQGQDVNPMSWIVDSPDKEDQSKEEQEDFTNEEENLEETMPDEEYEAAAAVEETPTEEGEQTFVMEQDGTKVDITVSKRPEDLEEEIPVTF